MFILLYLTAGVILLGGSTTLAQQCPHKQGNLALWSEPSTWPNSKKPREGGNVVITSPVLLDESPPSLYNLTIRAGGRLVFDPRHVLHVRVANIFVQGSMIIGSETCLYDGDLKITLTGTRDLHAGEEHPKVILVPAGGTLEIHGSRKLAWTKLDGTLRPLRETSDIIFQHQAYDPLNPTLAADQWEDRSYVSGIAAYTLRFNPGGKPIIKAFKVYDLVTEGDQLATQIQGVGDEELLMLASQHNIKLRDERSMQGLAFDALETLVHGRVTGNSKLRHVAGDSTYALVYYKGTEPKLSEDSNALGTSSRAHVVMGGRAYMAKVNGFSNANNQLDDFLVLTYNGLHPRVDVIDDVTSWKPGDKVVIASTDYDWQQAEERTVMECLDCTNNMQFRIDMPVNFVHWGEFVYGAVDMRGEVGLITRNVVIEGEMEPTCPPANLNCDLEEVRGLDTFGGHIKILEGFAAVHIEGAELRELGQQTETGRYPVHFHMCLDPAAPDNYVKETSIHNSFARCVTIHTTNNIEVVDNFCYNFMGHGYFLEDGAEINNTLDGNLAMTARKATGTLEPVDQNKPSGFWVTNPRTRFVNNVASGGEGTGIWFVYPDEVLGDSKPLNIMAQYEARSTPILEFYNNVAHSNSWVGIHLGSRLSSARSELFQNTWQPRENPKDPSSKPLKVKLQKLTGYKNRRNNIWIEGGLVELTKVSSSDSLNGIALTNDGLVDEFTGHMTECVMVGDSQNVGVSSTIPGRSVPLDIRPEEPHSGLVLWKGPTKHSNLWFGGDYYNEHYDSAAIAMKRFSPYFLSMQTFLTGMQFSFIDKRGGHTRAMSGLQGLDRGWRSRDGAHMQGFTYDTPESGFPSPAYITRPDHLSAAAKDCRIRENWRFAVCSTKYGNLKTLSSQPAVFVRHDLPAAQLSFTMAGQGGPEVVLDGSTVYTVHFEKKIPGKLVFTGEGMEKGDVLTIGVCIPKGGSFKLRARMPNNIKSGAFFDVGSLEELQRNSVDDGKKFYFDKKASMLYYKFIDTRIKAADEMHPCVDGLCPDIVIDKIKGDKSDGDCRKRLYGDDVNLPLPDQKSFNAEIPANAAALPPKGWGAGSTRPFTSRDTVDGGYSAWTEWSACSKTCGAGEQTRTRACNNPLPANGGKPCKGDSVETRACNDGECSINGAFTQWSGWGVCDYHSPGDCQGAQKRTRTCSAPAPLHGGIACLGATEEMQPCKKVIC